MFKGLLQIPFDISFYNLSACDTADVFANSAFLFSFPAISDGSSSVTFGRLTKAGHLVAGIHTE